jgi:hypothetical protein
MAEKLIGEKRLNAVTRDGRHLSNGLGILSPSLFPDHYCQSSLIISVNCIQIYLSERGH